MPNVYVAQNTLSKSAEPWCGTQKAILDHKIDLFWELWNISQIWDCFSCGALYCEFLVQLSTKRTFSFKQHGQLTLSDYLFLQKMPFFILQSSTIFEWSWSLLKRVFYCELCGQKFGKNIREWFDDRNNLRDSAFEKKTYQDL